MQKVYCPRCDRIFRGKTVKNALIRLNEHVNNAHPEYVEMWISEND